MTDLRLYRRNRPLVRSLSDRRQLAPLLPALPAGAWEVDLSALNGSGGLDVRNHLGAIVGEMTLTGGSEPTLTSAGLVFADGDNARIALTGALDVTRTASTVFMVVETDGNGMLLHDLSTDNTDYTGVYQDGSAVVSYRVLSTGAVEYVVDGTPLASGTTRDGLHTALNASGEPTLVEIQQLGLSGWDRIEVGGYGSPFNFVGTLRQLVVHLSGTAATAAQRARITKRLSLQ